MIHESASRRVYGSVDSSALSHNFALARKCAPNSRIMSVVKTNAYGHGLIPVAKLLDDSTDAFAVATLEEAASLRLSKIRSPICVLSGFFSPDDCKTLRDYDISAVIHCMDQINLLKRSANSKPVSVWLKVNTGMNRLGFPPQSLTSVLDKLSNLNTVDIAGIMSHFACADDVNSNYTARQFEQFLRATENIPLPLSIANSAGILKWPESHLDWIRPGIMLYGVSPIEGESANQLGLRPALNLYSRLIAVNSVCKGEKVGYGLNWTAPVNTRVGIIACGYGDGYMRSASGRTQVLIDERPADIVGTISMDSMAVDLTRHPQAKAGDRVKLFGKGMPVEQIAAATNTIPYEFLCSFNPRTAAIEFF